MLQFPVLFRRLRTVANLPGHRRKIDDKEEKDNTNGNQRAQNK